MIMSNQQAVVDRLRRSFLSGKSLPLEFRKAQLKNLLRLYDEGEDEVTFRSVSKFRTRFLLHVLILKTNSSKCCSIQILTCLASNILDCDHRLYFSNSSRIDDLGLRHLLPYENERLYFVTTQRTWRLIAGFRKGDL